MTKRYTDQLSDWVKKREKSRPRQDKGLVAFIAVKDDITEAIEAGYALKTIWEHLHETGKIPCRYETFLKHVKKQIKERPKVVSAKGTAPTPKADAKPLGHSSGPRVLKNTPKEFEVNPQVNKEDLI